MADVLPVKRLLPLFSAANVTRANMRIDKFRLEFKQHRIQSYGQSLSDDGLSSYLSFITDNNPLIGIHTLNNGNPAQAIRYRSNLLLDGAPAYFSRASNPMPREIHAHSQFRKFTLSLKCNFTRFYQVQQERAWELAAESNPVEWKRGGMWESRYRLPLEGDTINLLRDTTATPEQQQAATCYPTATLDGNDNILSEGLWRRTGNVIPLLSFYIALCMDETERAFRWRLDDEHAIPEINRHRAVPGYININEQEYLRQLQTVPLFNWSQGKVSQLEVYIEFAVDNALEFMRVYAPSLCEAARNYERIDYPIARAEEEQEDEDNALPEGEAHGEEDAVLIEGRELECPSLRLYLTDKISLAVYAKSDRRIRFEIRYSGSLWTTLNLRNRIARGEIPAIGRDEVSIIQMIDVAIDDAVVWIRDFITDLPLPQPLRYDVHILNRLLSEIAQVTESYEQAEAILSRLITNGSIAQDESNKSILQRLARSRRNVLTRIKSTKRPSPPRYRLTPAYYDVLRAFGELPQ